MHKETVASCPCCGQTRGEQDCRQLLTTDINTYFQNENGEITKRVCRVLLKKAGQTWACDECLQSGRAIKANINNQDFDGCNPHFAYFDKIASCRDCSNDFVFSKEEQRHWYEKLRLMVLAKEVRCNPCRYNKKMHTKLLKLLGNFDYKDMGKTQETVNLCIKFGFYQQAQHLLNLVQKRYKKTSAEFITAGKLLLEVEKAKQLGEA
jgi:hypothetical protein